MIVVEISYGEDVDSWWIKRSRDLTPSLDDRTDATAGIPAEYAKGPWEIEFASTSRSP